MRVWEKFLKVDGWRSNYPSVDNVLRHYSRKVRSEKTRENFCSTLRLFCKFCGLSPDELVDLSVEEASQLCQDYTDDLMDRDYSVKYINVCQAYLKTLFRENGFEGDRELKVERYYQPIRYRKKSEYVPTPEQIYKMAYAAGSHKNKAMVFALYTSGLRNSTLRALRYGDVQEELEAGLDNVKIPVYPGMKEMDPYACKRDIPYYTFINSDTVEALHEYLRERVEKFEGVADQEPLFCSDSNQLSPEEQRLTPVSKNGLERMVKRAAEQAGIDRWKQVSPKCLRTAFESALRNNRLDPKDQEFLMGHILPGSQDVYYDRTKVNQLRKKYTQIQFFPQKTTPKEIRKNQVLDTVKLLGFSEEKIKKVEEVLAQYETVDEAMDHIRKLSLDSYKGKDNPQNDPKKIVGEENLETYLQEGWNVQTVLPSGRILIQKMM